MLKLQIKLHIDHNEEDLIKAVKKELGVKEIGDFKIIKKSIDAREKSNILYVYSIEIEMGKKEENIIKYSKGRVTKSYSVDYSFTPRGSLPLISRPVIIGAGPAGLFAAYMLSKHGFSPIVLERGRDVDQREKDVEKFWATGILNPSSNVQFGEGGAGTFSDGKLNTQVKDKTGRIRKVLEIFVSAGANPSILYQNKPHLGTDELKKIVKNIRNEAIKNGAEFRFSSAVTDILYDKNNRLTGVKVNDKEIVETNVAILAIGHSARDTFMMLSEKPLLMSPKAFAIGVRIEHPQDMIGMSQYGESYKQLPSADYKLTGEGSDKRGIYSFCMCPGGFVVNASSEEKRLVVNGMSNSGRNERNANSALVVQVTPEDYISEGFNGPLSGVFFQRKWEERAYNVENGAVPAQLFSDFEKNVKSVTLGEVEPCIKGKYALSNISDCLPYYVRNDIISGIHSFNSKIKGYDRPDAVLSGVETRTSSPVRIERNEEFEAPISGLYPCGEGAGYAGGITSAAVDGIKVFEAIANKYMPYVK